MNLRVWLVAPATVGLAVGLLLVQPEGGKPLPATVFALAAQAASGLPAAAAHSGAAGQASGVYVLLWGPAWAGSTLTARSGRTVLAPSGTGPERVLSDAAAPPSRVTQDALSAEVAKVAASAGITSLAGARVVVALTPGACYATRTGRPVSRPVASVSQQSQRAFRFLRIHGDECGRIVPQALLIAATAPPLRGACSRGASPGAPTRSFMSEFKEPCQHVPCYAEPACR